MITTSRESKHNFLKVRLDGGGRNLKWLFCIQSKHIGRNSKLRVHKINVDKLLFFAFNLIAIFTMLHATLINIDDKR